MTLVVPTIGQDPWGTDLNTALHNLDDRIKQLSLVATDNGLVADGVTDNSAAANALIDAVEASGSYGTIYFPRGTYYFSAPLTPSKAMRFTGDYGAVLKTTASDLFNFAGNYMHPGYLGQPGIIEVDHLILDVTGGHVFTAPNINQGSFHDLIIYQRSSDKSVWNHPSGSGSLLWVRFDRIISNVYGATRSVPAWTISGSSTADVANVVWNHCLFQNPDADATQYQVLLQSTSGSSARYYHEQCAFRDCYFEMPYGGAVKSLSGHGTVFDNCRVYDVFTGTVGNSLFYIGQAANSTWPSTNTTFLNCGRDLQGPNGSATWDVQLESTCQQTNIISYDVRDIPAVFDGHPFLNLGNSAAVTLVNNRAQTLTNANGTGFWNITSDGSASGSGASQNVSPADCGYKAFTFKPDEVSATGIAPGNGVINLAKVIVRQPISVSTVYAYVTSAGATLTSGQNFAGIYDSSGTRVATTGDQTTAWGTTGLKPMSLTGGPFTLNPGTYWVALMSNATTRPSFGKNNNALDATLYNGTLTAANYRYATNGTGTTALPASITPGSNTALNVPWWVALN